jgi:YVTN family beta-propeller protein
MPRPILLGTVVALFGDDGEQPNVTAIVNVGAGAPGRAVVLKPKQSPQLLPIGTDPKAAVQSGSTIYVANYGSNNLSSFNPQLHDPPIKIIPLKADARPFGIALEPKSPRLYVTESGLGLVEVVDTSTDKHVAGIEIGGEPKTISISPDGCLGIAYDSKDEKIVRFDIKRLSLYGSRLTPPAELPVIDFQWSEKQVSPGVWQSRVVVADGTTWEFLELPCPDYRSPR